MDFLSNLHTHEWFLFFVMFVFRCLKCCFWCLEKFIRFINKNAYIMVLKNHPLSPPRGFHLCFLLTYLWRHCNSIFSALCTARTSVDLHSWLLVWFCEMSYVLRLSTKSQISSCFCANCSSWQSSVSSFYRSLTFIQLSAFYF